MAKPIEFFSKNAEFAWLSNFSPHGFTVGGEYWPTVEHFFQAAKFLGDEALEHRNRIRLSGSPKQAKALGQSRKHKLRPDWEDAKEQVMLVALRAKFSMPDLREKLLATGDRPLIEASRFDRYWGAGRDGRGKNRLGVLIMEVRAELHPSNLKR